MQSALSSVARDELARRRLGDFIELLEPSYQRPKHARAIRDHLEAVITSTDCTRACGSKKRGSAVMFFNYPDGGAATKIITSGLRGEPGGDSVSLAPD